MIIGIGGISRSGKTFLSEKLKELLEKNSKKVCILAQDDFVFPIEDIPRIKDHINWEVPESIDWNHFEKAIEESNKSYDIVIVEGLMIFWDKEVWDQLDHRIWIALSKETYFARKRVDLRWGKEPDWYIEYIWDSFQKYGQIPSGMKADLQLDGDGEFDIYGIFRGLGDNFV